MDADTDVARYYAERYIEYLEDLISDAAPLAWIATENVDAAQLWEMRAADLSKHYGEKI
jgi:hypothetical protein